ncbi:HD-GYP domain-containing protein [Polynucleobacter sp. JS-Safj-400b-B2]|nr:HD-GYP domain-containing protein [Polynucleobacter sp. JS-Safj-400b-B2]
MEVKAKMVAELVISKLEAINHEKLQLSLMETIDIARALVELRDPYTAGHEKHVGDLAKAIGAEMGLDEESIVGLKMAGLIHDIGKIAVPAEILTKPSALSGFEEKLVQLHPEQGYELLKDIEFPWPVADMVRQHHERIDGSGYPLGLRGDQILPGAKILAVADTLEAMSTHRPYRAALGLPAAIAQIKAESGKQLDAMVVSAAVKLFDGKESLDLGGGATD